MSPLSYQFHEFAYLAAAPARAMSELARFWGKTPLLASTPIGRTIVASAEMFERVTRRYGKPVFGLEKTVVDGRDVTIHETIVWQKPFCQLIRFQRDLPAGTVQPKLLIVAPMSGHYATLLRGTVEAFLPHYDVYITDWANARMIPAAAHFDLDDYIDYLVEICHSLKADGGALHTLGVCQPRGAAPGRRGVDGRRRRSPSAHDDDAHGRPDRYAALAHRRQSAGGEARQPVVPGQLHLSRALPLSRLRPPRVSGFFCSFRGFMAMNIDRHVDAHVEMFNHLVKGDGESGEKQRDFYDEYLAVMDLTAEFYLQTIDVVFVEHQLPKGLMTHRGKRVDLTAVRRVGMMTVEGENDDISGLGQTKAAHDLCSNLSDDLKTHHLQKDVGHYGVFNGSRFRRDIVPAIVAFHERIAAR